MRGNRFWKYVLYFFKIKYAILNTKAFIAHHLNGGRWILKIRPLIFSNKIRHPQYESIHCPPFKWWSMDFENSSSIFLNKIRHPQYESIHCPPLKCGAIDFENTSSNFFNKVCHPQYESIHCPPFKWWAMGFENTSSNFLIKYAILNTKAFIAHHLNGGQ